VVDFCGKQIFFVDSGAGLLNALYSPADSIVFSKGFTSLIAPCFYVVILQHFDAIVINDIVLFCLSVSVRFISTHFLV